MSLRTLQYTSDKKSSASDLSTDCDQSISLRNNSNHRVAQRRKWRTVLSTILACFISAAIFGATTGNAAPALTSPTPGSVLSGSTVSFTWTAGSGVTVYQVWAGSTSGSDNLGLCSGSTTSCQLTGLPTNGSTVEVMLTWDIGGNWQNVKYTYTAATKSTAPVLTSPAPGSVLSGSTVDFNWAAGSGVTGYQLWVGSTSGSDNLGLCSGSTTSCQLTGLPTNGSAVYVMLTWEASGAWLSAKYTYPAATKSTAPVLTSPAPGSVLSGSTVSFTWTAGSGVTEYQVWAGSTSGSDNLGLCSGSTTSCQLTGLPTNGTTVYVMLTWDIGGTWQNVKYTYSAAAATTAAKLTLQSTSVAFGDVTVGSPAYQSVTLTSSGTATLTISAGSLTGAGFTISGVSFPLTLSPNQTATMQIEFDPTTAGVVSGAVMLSSDSSTGAISTISLSGTGEAATDEVNVTWDAPTNSQLPIAGYYVYRAVSGSTTYAQMNSAVDTSTTYTDTTVAAGATYIYYVESVDEAGVTSVPSSTITITVP